MEPLIGAAAGYANMTDGLELVPYQVGSRAESMATRLPRAHYPLPPGEGRRHQRVYALWRRGEGAKLLRPTYSTAILPCSNGIHHGARRTRRWCPKRVAAKAAVAYYSLECHFAPLCKSSIAISGER
jgi:hypothetical protein